MSPDRQRRGAGGTSAGPVARKREPHGEGSAAPRGAQPVAAVPRGGTATLVGTELAGPILNAMPVGVARGPGMLAQA